MCYDLQRAFGVSAAVDFDDRYFGRSDTSLYGSPGGVESDRTPSITSSCSFAARVSCRNGGVSLRSV